MKSSSHFNFREMNLLREMRENDATTFKKEKEILKMAKEHLERRVDELLERYQNISVEEYDRMKIDVQHMQPVVWTLIESVCLPYANSRPGKGFPRPIIHGFTFQNAEIVFSDSTVTVCSDVTFTDSYNYSRSLGYPSRWIQKLFDFKRRNSFKVSRAFKVYVPEGGEGITEKNFFGIIPRFSALNKKEVPKSQHQLEKGSRFKKLYQKGNQ
ncbi:hypothetical protein POM88_025594 [Heracleum sosnowskyi]|uniref:Uncharacterized protein n=1 Tax=Heracleum sosnowskyi TaxID=360622 RepID=A0AAD8I7A5_9APIA|nr:hypothetical protein POM88_025594 [Heracleum sosnowskyi]